jgi:UbiD family decarboxylase
MSLKRKGELVEIEEEVDWQFEMGCLMRRTFDIPGGGPAVLFKRKVGIPLTQVAPMGCVYLT